MISDSFEEKSYSTKAFLSNFTYIGSLLCRLCSLSGLLADEAQMELLNRPMFDSPKAA